MSTFSIPYAFEMYGRLDIEASSLEEAYKKAEDELVNISLTDMIANASYLDDSLEIDEEGAVMVDGQWYDAEDFEKD